MSYAPLLPDRHPTQDFFIANIFDALPVKSDRHTMEHPFFTLSTKPDFRTIEYSRDGVHISLSPHHSLGLPTMMDKDILLYIGSLLMTEINAGRTPSQKLRFSSHDLMVTTNRHTNDVGYKMLDRAFKRLTGALMSTDIKTNEVDEKGNFHILESATVIRSSHDGKRMVRIEVKVSDWFYRAILAKEVLTINRDYFRLRKTLERRLYELARKHCGRQSQWTIGLENLREKCGALSPLNYFRHQIRETIKTNHLPDYQIVLGDKDKVTFINRKAASDEFVAVVDLPRITPETLRRGAKIVEDSGSGWDFHAIREQFTQSLIGGFTPGNANGAFINFVKKKVAQRP